MLQAWSQTHVTWNQTPANTKSSPLYSDACNNAHIGILFIFLQSYMELFLLLLFAVCFQVIQQVSFSFSVSSCIHCALSLCLFKTFSFPPILIPCSPPSIHLSISDPLTLTPHSCFHVDFVAEGRWNSPPTALSWNTCSPEIMVGPASGGLWGILCFLPSNWANLRKWFCLRAGLFSLHSLVSVLLS